MSDTDLHANHCLHHIVTTPHPPLHKCCRIDLTGIDMQAIFEEFGRHLAERRLHSVSEQVMLWPVLLRSACLPFCVVVVSVVM